MENKNEVIYEEGKERRKRITKSDMYREEREEFIKEMNKILGLNDTKRNIYKYEIETNKEFEKYIKENILKIRKMWKVGQWGYFQKKEKGGGNILGLYRSLLNNSGYVIYSKQKTKEINNEKNLMTLYYIEKRRE